MQINWIFNFLYQKDFMLDEEIFKKIKIKFFDKGVFSLEERRLKKLFLNIFKVVLWNENSFILKDLKRLNEN